MNYITSTQTSSIVSAGISSRQLAAGAAGCVRSVRRIRPFETYSSERIVKSRRAWIDYNAMLSITARGCIADAHSLPEITEIMEGRMVRQSSLFSQSRRIGQPSPGLITVDQATICEQNLPLKNVLLNGFLQSAA